jgi:flagellin
MSVVINTNSAATIASNNLSASNAMLQRSLNRLSSGSKIVNSSDDAGGVAVATRLGAAAKRTAATSNGIANALSFLQNQDSGLKTLGKMAERMNELQSMYKDSSMSATDKGNYTTEFNALRDRYESIRTNNTFNGTKLFDDSLSSGSTALSVTVDEAGRAYTLGNIDNAVTATDGKVPSFASAAIDEGGSFGSKTGTYAFAANAGTSVTINGYSVTVTTLAEKSTIISELNAKSASTNAIASLDSDGKLKLTGTVSGAALTITASALTTAWGLTVDATTNISAAAGSASATVVQDGITHLAGARAKNGADQSVLGYYQELSASTKANFESAISKIMDVDVAEESTQLARWNTLVQAGTAMIAQANGSTQSALTLLR